MQGKTIVIGALVLAAAAGCKKKQEAGPATEPAMGSGSAVAAADASEPADAPAAAAPEMLNIKEGLATPESVLYDAEGDRYLVTNINGGALEVDDNGYVLEIKPDGTSSKWIDASKDDVKLDAPKGSALSGGMLWIADITNVRRFDAKTGAQQPDIKIKGAAFLNDVVADGEGGIFVSDTGVDAKFKSTGADAIYQVSKDGKVTTRIKDKTLGGPNGIFPGAAGALWVATFSSGELFEVDAKGKKGKPEKLPKGGLDGLVVLDGGDVLVSSWEGKAVFRGKPGGEWKEVVSGVESPADFGWDAKRKQIVIPGFMTNTVTSHAIE